MSSPLGERIREARRRAGLNQAALATLLGTNAKSLSRWENGWRTPTAAALHRIAIVTGASVTWLVAAAGTAGAAEGVGPDGEGQQALWIPAGLYARIAREAAASGVTVAALIEARLEGGAGGAAGGARWRGPSRNEP